MIGSSVYTFDAATRPKPSKKSTAWLIGLSGGRPAIASISFSRSAFSAFCASSYGSTECVYSLPPYRPSLGISPFAGPGPKMQPGIDAP